jgi:hypothetical protein
METRGITFRKLSQICPKRDYFYRTSYSTRPIYFCLKVWHKYGNKRDIGCFAANCPVWRKLRRGDENTDR